MRPWISVEYDATFEMKDIDVADRVTFGTYSGEPITWIVLESDKNGLNLLSKYGLEKMMMDKDNEEYDRYNNNMALFNEAYNNFEKWYNRTYMPLSKGKFRV